MPRAPWRGWEDEFDNSFDRPFSRADVRNYPDLTDAAEEYAREYKGNFEFLLSAQKFLHEVGSLPKPMIKGVLNCMRHDKDIDDKLQKMYKLRTKAAEPIIQIKPRPAWYLLTVKWNMRFAYSVSLRTKYCHILDTDHSYIKYYSDIDKYESQINLMCASSLTQKHVRLAKEPPRYLLICRRCIDHAADLNDQEVKALLKEIDGRRAR